MKGLVGQAFCADEPLSIVCPGQEFYFGLDFGGPCTEEGYSFLIKFKAFRETTNGPMRIEVRFEYLAYIFFSQRI